MQSEDYKRIWLNWQVSYCSDHNSLLSSSFRVEESKHLDGNVRVPWLWINGLAEKYSWLHTLRTLHHIPENPEELVKFIQQVEDDLI